MSKEKKEKILFFGQTDMGRQRTNNEDAFVAIQLDKNTILAVAIDGVGGYEGGEVAAEIAQKEIPAYLKEFSRGERLELLKQAVVSANNAIVEQRQLDPERANMSCVLTAALIDKERKMVDMVHVGDTRMYQFYRGMLSKLSHDHSLIGYREEIGDLTEEEAMHHPQRNVISRDVGSARHEVGDPDFLEAEEFPLLPNSTFLLCSDGLTDLITSKQIVAILELPDSLEKKTKMLIDAANEAGGKDNVTVVLVEYQAEEVQPTVAKDVVSPVENDVEESTSEVPGINVSNTSNTEKKVRNRILWVLLAVIALLLGACIAVSLRARSEQKKVQTLNEQVERMSSRNSGIVDNVADSLNDTIANLKEGIDRYTKALENIDDIKPLLEMYADTVRRYINAKNLTNAQVINKIKQYDNDRKIISKQLSVRWNTLTKKQLPNGEVMVDFVEDYKTINKDSTEASYVVHYLLTFDRDGKIVSVLEDLLQEGE